MNRLSDIRIISVDLFRTLVDIPPTPEFIWKLFLKPHYPDALSRQYRQRADEILSRRWDDASLSDGAFKNVRVVLGDTCEQLFQEINLVGDPKSAADLLMKEHTLDTLFPDAVPFLDALSVRGKYQICLSTDCDVEMLSDLGNVFAFDHLFVSERLRLYKLNPSFFRRVLDHYGVMPENVLHVGDAKADILGPQQVGLATCWLNRQNRKWDNPVAPDFAVKSLLDIMDILV